MSETVEILAKDLDLVVLLATAGLRQGLELGLEVPRVVMEAYDRCTRVALLNSGIPEAEIEDFDYAEFGVVD